MFHNGVYYIYDANDEQLLIKYQSTDEHPSKIKSMRDGREDIPFKRFPKEKGENTYPQWLQSLDTTGGLVILGINFQHDTKFRPKIKGFRDNFQALDNLRNMRFGLVSRDMRFTVQKFRIIANKIEGIKAVAESVIEQNVLNTRRNRLPGELATNMVFSPDEKYAVISMESHSHLSRIVLLNIADIDLESVTMIGDLFMIEEYEDKVQPIQALCFDIYSRNGDPVIYGLTLNPQGQDLYTFGIEDGKLKMIKEVKRNYFSGICKDIQTVEDRNIGVDENGEFKMID